MEKVHTIKKLIREHCISVSIFWLHRHGYLLGGKSGTVTHAHPFEKNIETEVLSSISGNYGSIILGFEYDGVHLTRGYQLVTTSCYYGGQRFWLICHCGTRVGVLYRPRYKFGYFACRHCYNLSYNSRNQCKRSFLINIREFYNFMLKQKPFRKRFYKGKETKRYQKYKSFIQRLK